MTYPKRLTFFMLILLCLYTFLILTSHVIHIENDVSKRECEVGRVIGIDTEINFDDDGVGSGWQSLVKIKLEQEVVEVYLPNLTDLLSFELHDLVDYCHGGNEEERVRKVCNSACVSV
ncbi:MAG: hypothetical protein H6779_05345 [Candidatus Nomurabacteria bacterium]|nr:MAG: hypothetical protein H6779_05345 [Candidatus Nomurabacteria bacterium]